MTETCTYSFSVKAYILLIGVSLSEPHTSELNDEFFMAATHICLYNNKGPSCGIYNDYSTGGRGFMAVVNKPRPQATPSDSDCLYIYCRKSQALCYDYNIRTWIVTCSMSRQCLSFLHCWYKERLLSACKAIHISTFNFTYGTPDVL